MPAPRPAEWAEVSHPFHHGLIEGQCPFLLGTWVQRARGSRDDQHWALITPEDTVHPRTFDT